MSQAMRKKRSSTDTSQPASTWDDYTLASMLYVYAKDHPNERVQEAMVEASHRICPPRGAV